LEASLISLGRNPMLLITRVALDGTLRKVKYPFASVVVPSFLLLMITDTFCNAFPALSVTLPVTVVSAKDLCLIL
jgi:hypothetical protein